MVVIGGGATGAEMASEIASKYPRKSVTLVTSGKQLVPDISVDKFKNKTKDILIGKGVKLILGMLQPSEIPIMFSRNNNIYVFAIILVSLYKQKVNKLINFVKYFQGNVYLIWKKFQKQVMVLL